MTQLRHCSSVVFLFKKRWPPPATNNQLRVVPRALKWNSLWFRLGHNTELKQSLEQNRVLNWATHSTGSGDCFILGQWFCPNFQANRLSWWEWRHLVKTNLLAWRYIERKEGTSTSGCRASLKNTFAPYFRLTEAFKKKKQPQKRSPFSFCGKQISSRYFISC